MKRIVFLDADTLGGDISLEPIANLGEFIKYPFTAPSDVVERISNCDVLIVNKVIIGKAEIDSAPNLKLICVAATGTNNIDIPYANSKGISVKNAVNYSTESVAQTTFMFILNMVGSSSYFDTFVKSGAYSNGNSFTDVSRPFYEIKGKRLGIIGLGNIGSRVASIATAFGMEVVYYATSGIAHSEEYTSLSLEELLSTSDIVSIHSPLNERTENLIDLERLSLMKPTAYIVNMGRGGIINEADLATALDQDLIAAAGVDVFTKEPIPSNHPYLTLKNSAKLFLTPHIGWASREARTLLVQKIADNII